jgi:hypothetical protein
MDMKYLELYETFTNKVVIGIDIDGTLCNFSDAYNNLYKTYFPDKEPALNDDWYWYQRMDYNGVKPGEWFRSKKAEVFDLAQPYPDAVNTLNNIYDFIKTHGFTLNIVTCQQSDEAKAAAKVWIDKYGFKYDEIILVDASKDKWKHADIMVDDADKVVGSKPVSKVCIKIDKLWNTATDGDINIPNIKGLTIDVMQQAISKLKNKTTL